MVQEATFAPTTLLPSEVRAALSPHAVPAAAPVLPGPQQPGGVGLGLAWLLWGGGPGAAPRWNRGPPHSIPHMTGGGEAGQHWDGSVALTVSIPVLPPALPSPSHGRVLAAKLA